MSLIGLCTFIFFFKPKGNGYTIGLNTTIFKKSNFQGTWWPFTGFLLYFLWIIISILWSGGQSATWFQDVTGKLGIFGISFIFIFIPKLDEARVKHLHHVLFGTLIIAILLILVIYIPSYEDITLRIGRGRPIPTPIDHVRFSMITAYGSLSAIAIFFGLKKLHFTIKNYNWIYLVIGFFLFIACHLLAVRTGILLLYSGIFILISFHIINNKKYLIGIIVAGLFLLIPIIAYNTIESFRNKVSYTKYDIELMLSNKGDNFSDGDRLRSIKNGLSLWKEHPLLGPGAGEYKQAMKGCYTKSDQNGKSLLPHNQFVRSGMAYGWIGVLLLLSGFFIALFYKLGYTNILLILILQIFFFSLFVESSLERYYALVFFFLFIGINSSLNRKNIITA